jgi:hypothetical protein
MMKSSMSPAVDTAIGGIVDRRAFALYPSQTQTEAPQTNVGASPTTAPENREPITVLSEFVFPTSQADPSCKADFIKLTHAGDRIIVELADKNDNIRHALTLAMPQANALAEWFSFVTSSF